MRSTRLTRGRLRRLRPLAVLRLQVPLLRLQQPCARRRHRREPVSCRLPDASWRTGRRLHRAAQVTSIFLGGGTPSLMKPHTVGAVLDAIGRNWAVAPDAEITLEANPSSVEAGRFRGYRAAGVNRVSLGVQALDDARSALARPPAHVSRRRCAAIGVARDDLPRLSFDLIYARPGQTLGRVAARARARRSAYAADHLSLYQLTIEEGTPFQRCTRAASSSFPTSDAAPTSTS